MNISSRCLRFVGTKISTALLCIPVFLLTSIALSDDPLSAVQPIRLYAAAAQVTGAARFAKREDWLAIEGESAIAWMATIDREGQYRASIVFSGNTPGAPFTLSLGNTVVNGTLDVQTRVFDDPLMNFGQKIAMEGTRLPRGPLRVQLRIPNGKAQLRIRSIDIEPMPTAEAAIQERKIAQERANTDWLARAAYGVMFHWTSESKPRHGPALPYQRAVDAFDVPAFAEMVENTGARYVIFTVNHAQPHCPAPIKSWERIYPGSTTKRDLLGEIAQALEARNIKLMLYFASHTVGRLRVSTSAEYLRIHKEILQEIGQRYGARVAGYWFDGWYQTLEAYPEINPHDLLPYVRAGNPARLVAFNSWVYPVETPWQDYWAGEVGDLVRPATSRYITSGNAIGLQSHFLLYADAPWVHSLPDTEMEPLRFSNQALIDFVKKNAESEAAVTINLGIYQDGSIGEAARRQMTALRHAIRGK
jgi:hypothetical protein